MGDNSRPEFREWVDRQPAPGWGLMPLTHISKSLIAKDIAREGRIAPAHCPVFERALAYFFYGRPAYRTKGDGPVRNLAACPMCLIFDPSIIEAADCIHPFDTGAFNSRLYKHVMLDEMNIADFSLGTDASRPNKLISAVYGDRAAYFDGDTRNLASVSERIPNSEFLARSYIDLLTSPGRNEPDDRVGTIEITFGQDVQLEGTLIAIVVPDLIWNDRERADWLAAFSQAGVEILPFRYLHAREPEHHHAMIEIEVRNFFAARGEL